MKGKNQCSSCCWELLNTDIIHPHHRLPIFLLLPHPPTFKFLLFCYETPKVRAHAAPQKKKSSPSWLQPQRERFSLDTEIQLALAAAAVEESNRRLRYSRYRIHVK